MHWELVIVDDGSPDGTWEAITALSARDTRVRGVRLSRNFGHQNALLAGLTAARGQAIVTMDADLQHPPEIVPQLIARWLEGYQIVHAIRRDPANVPMLKRVSSRLYYRLFSYLSGVEIEPGAADFRLQPALGQQRKQARLAIASGGAALCHGPRVVLQGKERGLLGLRGLPCLELRVAQLEDRFPAISRASDHETIGRSHDPPSPLLR